MATASIALPVMDGMKVCPTAAATKAANPTATYHASWEDSFSSRHSEADLGDDGVACLSSVVDAPDSTTSMGRRGADNCGGGGGGGGGGCDHT